MAKMKDIYFRGNKVRQCYFRGKKIHGWNPPSDTPPPPMQKYGLVFSGTQWIRLPITLRSDWDVECDQIYTDTSVNRCLWSCRKQGSVAGNNSLTLFVNVGNTLRFDVASSSSSSSPPSSWFKNSRLTFLATNNGSQYLLKNKKLGGTIISINGYTVFESEGDTGLGAAVISGESPSAQYVGTIFNFKVTEQATGNVMMDLRPVPMGNTQYSSTPAPSNCVWDTVSQQYLVNARLGTFGIVDDGLLEEE